MRNRIAFSLAALVLISAAVLSATVPRNHAPSAELTTLPVQTVVHRAADGRASRADVQEGTWTASSDRRDGRLQLNLRFGESQNWGQGYDLSELRGLSRDAVDAAGTTPVQFRLEREPGAFDFDGSFREGRGAGHFRFRGNPEFASVLRGLGIRGGESLTDDEMIALTLTNTSADEVRALTRLDLGTLTVENLVEMGIHGVTAEYVRSMRAAGLQGISSTERAVEMRIHGLTPEYVAQMGSLGLGELSREQLLEMSIHGVRPAAVEEFRALGMADLSARELVDLRIHGVTPEYIREMREGGFSDVSAEELMEMRIHGVTPEFARELAELGYRDLSHRQLVDMRIHGVTPAFIRELREEGYARLTPAELVDVRIMGRGSLRRRARGE